MNTLKMQLVRQYQSLGWRLFPLHSADEEGCSCRKSDCKNAGKHPYSKLAPNGFKNATNDLETLENWFGVDAPWVNIGVATGMGSGINVIDIDPRHGGDGSWARWLTENNVTIPKTLISATGGGGHHYFFSYEQGLHNKNDLLRGVDFKTDGGYVVLPPSSHESGWDYRWPDGMDPSHEVAEMPAELIVLLQRSSSVNTDGERLPDPETILQGISEGKRDDTLFRWACQLRRLLKDNRELIELLVLMAASHSDPPFPQEQALAKVEQAFKQDHADDGEEVSADGIRQTDGGNGTRFARRFGHEFIYVVGPEWYGWDGSIWVPQNEVEAEVRAKEIVEEVYALAQDESLDAKAMTKAAKFAAKTDSPRGINSMLRMARSDPGLMRSVSEMNIDPMKLAVANGVVDLTTGELLPVSRHDMITGRSPIEYDPLKGRPKWDGFVRWAMQGDQEMVEFLQRLAGYSITGLFSEHIFPVFLGPGGNGKNTFVETIVEILGNLAEFPFSSAALLSSKEDHQRTGDLYGKRLAVVSETNKGAAINTGTLKSYTGDGRLKGKWLYKDMFNFDSTHTLWFMSNHRPRISDDSDGVWRRILLIPWNATVTEEQKIPKYHEVMLHEEGPAIVAWLVQGAIEYQRKGLLVPKAIKARTDDYRQTEDVLGAFAEDCLLVGSEYDTTRAELKFRYTMWCDNNDVPRSERDGVRTLVDALRLKFPGLEEYRPGGGERRLRGVGVKGIEVSL